MVLYGMVWNGMVWYDMVCNRMLWYGMVLHAMIMIMVCGMVWLGMA